MKKEITKQQMLEAHKNDGIIGEGRLNEVITTTKIRADGSRRIQQDFQFCPTMAEQHTAHLTNINYLIERYKPDELQAYINARNQYRQEIVGHDFSKEPDLQQSKNIIYRSKSEFDALPDDVKLHFKNHLEFLKFIDNSANAEKMLKLGILTQKQINNIQIPEDSNTTPTPTKTQDEEKAK